MANVPGVIDRRTVWRKENIVCVFQRGGAVLMVMVMVVWLWLGYNR